MCVPNHSLSLNLKLKVTEKDYYTVYGIFTLQAPIQYIVMVWSSELLLLSIISISISLCSSEYVRVLAIAGKVLIQQSALTADYRRLGAAAVKGCGRGLPRRC